jgi:hypothetical protein
MTDLDETKVVLDFLGGQVTLSGVRLFADVDAAPPPYKPADGPAICLKVRCGSDDNSGAVQTPSFQFKIYGQDESDARETYRKLHAALTGDKSHAVMAAERESLGVTLKEPGAGWTYVLVFYSIMVRTYSTEV